MKKALLIILILSPVVAYAGGMSWQVEVLDFQRISDTEAKAKIATFKEKKPFDGCSKFKVLFKFDLEKIESTSIKHFVSKDSQVKSLDKLERISSRSNPIMMLGSMGSGFKKIGDCTFKSIGLALLKEYSGKSVVYSFHNPI